MYNGRVMPELPEVETVARGLRASLVGRTIVGVGVRWARSVVPPDPAAFARCLTGQTVADVGRRGKWVVIALAGGGTLLIHLRMSGDLYIKEEKAVPEKHDRLILTLTPSPLLQGEGRGVRESNLVFNDTRKFGRVWLVDDPDEVIGGLGPEPLSDEYTAEMLYTGLQSRHRQLKPLLLDQSFLAGMGNIYTDEALHMARLHPLRLSDSVSEREASRLWNSIRETLRMGVEQNGSSIDWVYRGGGYQHHFRVYGRTGQPCPVCGTPIERILVGQRSTHFCPVCQAEEARP